MLFLCWLTTQRTICTWSFPQEDSQLYGTGNEEETDQGVRKAAEWGELQMWQFGRQIGFRGRRREKDPGMEGGAEQEWGRKWGRRKSWGPTSLHRNFSMDRKDESINMSRSRCCVNLHPEKQHTLQKQVSLQLRKIIFILKIRWQMFTCFYTVKFDVVSVSSVVSQGFCVLTFCQVKRSKVCYNKTLPLKPPVSSTHSTPVHACTVVRSEVPISWG